ncbi:MarR family transcriptional regulator [Kribbella sp. NPDC003557]|uniref:MarR family transcriptional regulator n=1 Tax=Kribbella sp. NPDC003557 TaxID=3154449 RepID=UPI0033BAE6B7
MTIEDARTRPLTDGSQEAGSGDGPVVANALVVPERVIGGVVPSPVRPGPAGIVAVQTEQLISDVSTALRLLDALERVRGHAHPLIMGLQEAVGITMPAALVLSAIANGCATIAEVAQQVGITAGEAELAIADLETLGMARTTPALGVTGLGQARLSQLDGLTVRVLDVVTGILGPTDAAHLARLLHTVADGLQSASVAAAVSDSRPQVAHN